GQLLVDPQRFEFFQAVRLVSMAMRLGAFANDCRVEPAAAPMRLRFNSRLSMAFPPSQIGGVTRERPSYGGPEYGIRITPAFLGMLGSTGVLPLHYTQRIATYERETGDGAPRAFIDMLSHRSQGMFYQA